MMKRRDFLKAGVTAAGAWVAWKGGFVTPKGYAYQVSAGLQKFIQPLPRFVFDIPLAAADTTTYSNVDYYEIQATVFRQQLHPNLPVTGTRLYGYQQLGKTAQALGAPVLATKNKPVRIKFSSNLPVTHILPFDSTISQGANVAKRQDTAAIHLHGGLTPWTSDGGPFHWQSNPANSGGNTLWGSSVTPWLPDAGGVNTWDYYYPNAQSARLMWYHDHAVGITRLNAYAGVATGYVLQDANDNLGGGLLQNTYGIPFVDLGGSTNGQILVFQDKVFWDPARDNTFGNLVPGAAPGDLWYPWQYDPLIWAYAPPVGAPPLPIPSIVTEMFGDTMMVNSAVYPFADIGTDRVRYRLLNACQGRFLNLSFVIEDPLVPGEPLLGAKGVPTPAPVNVWLLGTEGGFLPQPVQLFANGVPMFLNAMLVGPAERFDIIVDFSLCANQKVILYNDAPGPYPGGAPIFDFYFGAAAVKPKKNANPNAPIQAGFGPNTRTIMQFRVAQNLAASGTTIPTTIPPADQEEAALRLNLAGVGGTALPAFPAPLPPLDPATAVLPAGFAWGVNDFLNPRYLTLNEEIDTLGRLMPTIGTNTLVPGTNPPAFGRPYPYGPGNEPTEMVQYRTAEVWKIINLTADTHPMHFHLFNVRVLSREPMAAVKAYNGGIPATTRPRGPEWNEMGWKETVKMHPGEVTTVLVLVEPPLGLTATNTVNRDVPVIAGLNQYTGTLPQSPRLAAMGAGFAGDEYVWHCHILEHEEHDMMRPLVGN